MAKRIETPFTVSVFVGEKEIDVSTINKILVSNVAVNRIVNDIVDTRISNESSVNFKTVA